MKLMDIGVFFILGFAILVIIGTIIYAASVVLTFERITVQGDVIDVIAHDDYMTIVMDNGNSYDVHYPGDNIDLTKGSTIIMRLTNEDVMFIDDGIWNEVSITKIPDV